MPDGGVESCNDQDLMNQMAPERAPTIRTPSSHTACSLFPCVRTGPTDSFLSNRGGQSTRASVLLALSHFLTHLLWGKPAALGEAPCGKE